MCDNLFNVSDALAKQKQNPLNKLCASCYIKSNKETSVSNESETTNNSKMIVEGDKENKSNNNTKNREVVPEEVYCTKNLSVLVLNFLNYFHLLYEIKMLQLKELPQQLF